MAEDDESRRKRLAKWKDEHFYEPIRKPDAGGRHAPRLPKFLPSLIVLLIIGLIGTWFVFAGLARLRGSEVSWFWPDIGSLSADGALFDVTRSTATLAALAAGLFAAVYAYRKQRVDEAAGKRADDEALSKRYQDAAEQLGHEKAAVRLAGAYAMARLADDWPEQQQTCVDVLCAYVRTAWPLRSDGKRDKGDKHVRQAITKLIASHTYWLDPTIAILADSSLLPTTDPKWYHLDFDFSGAELADVDLSSSLFTKKVNFEHALLGGKCKFDHVTFWGGGNFLGVKIAGVSTFDGVTIGTSSLELQGIEILKGAELSIRASHIHEDEVLDLTSMILLGKFKLSIRDQGNPRHVDVRPAGGVVMANVQVRGGTALITGNSFVYPIQSDLIITQQRVAATDWSVSCGGTVDVAEWISETGRIHWGVTSASPTAVIHVGPGPMVASRITPIEDDCDEIEGTSTAR